MSGEQDELASLLGRPQLARVPSWLYETTVCGITRAGMMWTLNAVCAAFHLILAVISVAVAAQGGLDSPLLTVYGTELDWVEGETNALKPKYLAYTGGYNLGVMTMSFFLLSFLAHALVCVGNYRQAFDGAKTSRQEFKDQFFNGGWYWRWMHECRQPLRWVEYSFSASVMIITISVASGVSHVYMVQSIFSLMWCTMAFGYYTEVTSPPSRRGLDPTEPARVWAVRAPEGSSTLTLWRFKLWRLAPHLLGYVPYSTVWAILGHSFFSNTSNGGPPSFVYAIVLSQFGLFTGFGVTQFWNQIREDGPSWYYRGEISYLVLSLLSKGVLGFLLIGNVLVYSSFDRAVSEARTAEAR